MPTLSQDTPRFLSNAASEASDGSTSGEATKIFLLSSAAFLAIISANAFFDQFNFCPICGGDGQSFYQLKGDRFRSKGTCPLLFLAPHWHTQAF